MKRDKEQARKQDSRKLTLSKETVRSCTEDDLTKILGGQYTYLCGTSGNPRCTCPV